MVESALKVIHIGTSFHQFLHLDGNYAGGEGFVAVGRHHEVDLHPPFQCSVERASYGAGEGGVGIHYLYGMLCVVDGSCIRLAHDAAPSSGFTVDHSHAHIATAGVGAGISGAVSFFAGYLLPHLAKQSFKFGDCGPMDAHVHVTPFAYRRPAVDVIVAHVHAARVGCVPVYSYNLPVVAMVGMVDVRETVGVKFIDAYAVFPQVCLFLFREGKAAGEIAESVKEYFHLHALAGLFLQEVEGGIADAVVAKVVKLHVDISLRLFHDAQHVIK